MNCAVEAGLQVLVLQLLARAFHSLGLSCLMCIMALKGQTSSTAGIKGLGLDDLVLESLRPQAIPSGLSSGTGLQLVGCGVPKEPQLVGGKPSPEPSSV